MEISLLTPKCTLVPADFYNPESARESLGKVVRLEAADEVKAVEIARYGAVLLYAAGAGTGTLINEDSVSGEEEPLPEMFFILRDLQNCSEYNKILCSWHEGHLYMAIAQGKTLLLANVYEASDFTTAEYYIFLAVKSLQINPEVSSICWRSPIGSEDELSLYRYFKAVEKI